jgi:hypothetical protein
MTKEEAMTTSTRKTTTSLREAAAALQDAELALRQQDDHAAHEALLALARTSYDSLSRFERATLPAGAPVHALEARLTTWRQELDEMRVQLALAQMEAREAGGEIAHRVEQTLGPATSRISSAVKDIAGVLADLRRGLTDRAS